MDSETGFALAREVLLRGEAVVFPTDTVYGLGVAVRAAESPALLYDAKDRDGNKPIAWLVGSHADLLEYGVEVSDAARAVAEAFWPGPLTLIVKASQKVSSSFLAGGTSIGLRMPQNECALALIQTVGCPLATTSANVSGESPVKHFLELDDRILSRASCVIEDVDNDKDASGLASTVLDCTGEEVRMLREGSISFEDIQRVLARH